VSKNNNSVIVRVSVLTAILLATLGVLGITVLALTFSNAYPSGQTLASQTSWFNITISSAISDKCVFTLGLAGNNSYVGNFTMTNQSTTTFYNSSFVFGSDSGYNQPNNVTFYCLNNTVYINSSVYTFDADTVKPLVSLAKYNLTYSGGFAYLFFNVSDTHYSQCGFFVNNTANNATFIAGTVGTPSNGINSRANCTALINPSSLNLPYDGNFYLQGWANDTLGNGTYSSTNQTIFAKTLYPNKWNLITYYGANDTYQNETVREFYNNHNNGISQIAVWNETSGTFITWSASAPTVNQGTVLYPGEAVYLYGGANSLVSPDYIGEVYGTARENVTLSINTSSKATSWNILPLYFNTTINSTLYALTYNDTYPSAGQAKLMNITFVSWFNASSGQYITCRQGYTICAGTTATPDTVVLPKGTAVWVLTDRISSSIILNTTRISG